MPGLTQFIDFKGAGIKNPLQKWGFCCGGLGEISMKCTQGALDGQALWPAVTDKED